MSDDNRFEPEQIDKYRRRKRKREVEELIADAEATTRARMFTFLGTVAGVLEKRGEAYGPVETHWSRTAALWSLLLEHKLVEPLTPRDVARLYVADKLSRDVSPRDGAALKDTALDIAGYAAGMAALEPDEMWQP